MAQKRGTAEWFVIANEMKGCICPTCQTGKDNLAVYPAYCPHADSLTIETESDWTEMQCRKPNGKFSCKFYQPLKEETEMKEQTHDDAVNHPSHYTTGGIECIDYIQEKLTPEEFKGFVKGNVIKYLTREQHKNGDEDICKAQWYLNRLADTFTKTEKNE